MQVDDAHDIHVVMLIYSLIEESELFKNIQNFLAIL